MVMNTIQQVQRSIKTKATQTHRAVTNTLQNPEFETLLLAVGAAYLAGVHPPATTVFSQQFFTALAVIATTGALTRHAVVITTRNPWGPETFTERITDITALALYALAYILAFSPYVL